MAIHEDVGVDKMISYLILKQSEQVGVIGTSFAQWPQGQGKGVIQSPRGPLPQVSEKQIQDCFTVN